MPRAARKLRRARRKPARKPRRARKVTNISDVASCSVARTLHPEVSNTMYAYNEFQLGDYQRATAIASNYQEYKITGITVTWRPPYDTFSAAVGAQKPSMYVLMNKGGAVPPNVTLEAMKQMGSRPRAFDEGPLRVTFRPTVLSESMNVAFAPSSSATRTSPWLSTNGNATNPGAWIPSTVAHLGFNWYIDQPGGNTTFLIDVEVQFAFRKPNFTLLSSVPARGMTFARLNDSPDGVEGGGDGF